MNGLVEKSDLLFYQDIEFDNLFNIWLLISRGFIIDVNGIEYLVVLSFDCFFFLKFLFVILMGDK